MSDEMADVFVIMPFGKKPTTPFTGGHVADFDEVYRAFITPACALLGLECRRIDEVSFAGSISKEIVKFLLQADVVIADLTSANPNVYFELGIRQSLSERPTVLIANTETLLPFDIHDQKVVFYNFPAKPFTQDEIFALSTAVKEAGLGGVRSPILSRLRELGTIPNPTDQSAFEADLRQRVTRASTLEQLTAIWHWAAEQSPLPPYLLLELADRISAYNDWLSAATIAKRAIAERSGDFELHRRYGWYLRNAGPDHFKEAEEQFRRALELNQSDPETLGMLGGLLKRAGRYKEAADAYDKALRLSPTSLYIRVAHAGMTFLSALEKEDNPNAATALYDKIFNDLQNDASTTTNAWNLTVMGECAFVLGCEQEAIRFFSDAARLAADPTVLKSPADQLDLFADQGFRPSQARDIAALLRSLTKPGGGISPEAISKASREMPPTGLLPTIVHMSDIHFGSRLNAKGEREVMHRFFDGDYSQSLVKHLRHELIDPKGRFRLTGKPVTIVVSGDFVYSGTSQEFDDAINLFSSLRDELKLDSRQFVFCPGNHDVNWAKSQISKAERFDPYLIFLRKFYGMALFTELYPLVTWDFSVMTPRPDPSNIVSVCLNKEQRLLFASFNSCVYETEQHHYGFISQPQQRKAAMLLEKLDIPEDTVRIAVVHHHVHPYPDFVPPSGDAAHWVDMSTIRDGGLFERFLKRRGFDLALHGHKHRPQLRETVVRDRHSQDQIKSLIVCGAGSCGVAHSELEHSMGNQFEVLEVTNINRLPGADFVRIEWREIAFEADAEWSTTRVWKVLGG